MADSKKDNEKLNQKELSIDNLDKVTGGINDFTFKELDAEGKATFLNRHVEIHYLTDVFRSNRSHGGTITEALCTSGRGCYDVVVKVTFDDWSEGNGWFWWETIWDNKVFPYESVARGKSTPNDLGIDFISSSGSNSY